MCTCVHVCTLHCLRVNSFLEIPWLCVGDFNKITKQDEKVGGAIRPHNQMQSFREVINKCGFIDLGYIGPKYTWCRHYENGNSIWEQLGFGHKQLVFEISRINGPSLAV